MRVLVARPAEPGEATGRALEKAGHEPLLAPILTVRLLDTPFPGDRPFGAVVITSRHAVRALAPHRGHLGGFPVFAVGNRTAAALREAGWEVAAIGTGDGAAQARSVAAAVPAGTTILHPAGRDRKAEPRAGLERAGFAVVTWIAYAAEAAETLPAPAAVALRAGRLDAALHYSGRSAAILARLATAAGFGDAFAGLTHVCLSADISAALPKAAKRVLIAERPDEAALFASLERAQAGSPPPQSRC